MAIDLDHDDRRRTGPAGRRSRHGKPGDLRVDEDRRGGDAGHDQRPAAGAAPAWKKPLMAKMQNSGLRAIRSAASTSSPAKKTTHPAPSARAGLRAAA